MRVAIKEDIRRTILRLGCMVAMLPCLLLLSCSEDEFIEEVRQTKGTDSICFGVSSGETATKGDSGDSYNAGTSYNAGHLVLRSEESADTLCLSATISDGIYSSDGICSTNGIFSSDDAQTLTRGTPVSNESFYDHFHVVAYWTENNVQNSSFYLNETATNDGSDIWSTTILHYWPGIGNELRFLAWAPTNLNELDTPSNPSAGAELTYTVPAAAASQNDIVVAMTEYLAGDYNTAVPLEFQHICSAIRIVVGSQMQSGTINSVTLSGVNSSGTYSPENSEWTLDGSTSTFTQSLNLATTGYENEGDTITTDAGTFMMIPQTLPDGATVEVSFTNSNGETSTLSASIGGMEWPMGKTVTYKLSISPEYDLEFTTSPAVQDAHYVVYPISIKANDVPNGSWILTSDDSDNVTFVEKSSLADGLQNLIDQGYWLKEYCGSSSLTSSTSGDNIEVYVFLKENVTEADRDITLSLSPVSGATTKPATFEFTQYCPAWQNGIGVERLQEADYPWGFEWDSDMTITYSMNNVSGLFGGILRALFDIFASPSYVSSSGIATFGTWKVTIDFSKVSDLDVALSEDNGLTNTWELYTFDGLNEASTIMNQLESWGGTANTTLPTNPSEYAAWACAKKNPYTVTTETNSGYTVYNPVLAQEDMLWYLPARNEAPYMNDDLYPLSGDYWTSTAITDPGNTAYKVSFSGGTTSEENRNSSLHVRAVRQQSN